MLISIRLYLLLTRWITEGHITPLAAFNRFWGYTFHLMQEDEITNDEYNQVQLEYLQEIIDRFLPSTTYPQDVIPTLEAMEPLHRWDTLLNFIFNETPVQYDIEDQEGEHRS
ncbi:hypothetical protein [Ruminococcus sp. AF17-12]|uniref:hypothetical protein n=1 Tax=Ruminococcus sp. AF17-12 TaxID=2293151 RepID=UPI0011C3912B|nr:hypothetical protein [Ruminococcus sp. AF17-12]